MLTAELNDNQIQSAIGENADHAAVFVQDIG